MSALPGQPNKIANCGLCGIYTYMAAYDNEIGWACEDCNPRIKTATSFLAHTAGLREPRRGDWMPIDEMI